MKLLLPKQSNDAGRWHEADRSPVTAQVDIEFTSDCNLRCVYCPVSSDTYHGETMAPGLVARLLDDLPSRGVKHIGINGHGETTIIPDWTRLCAPFVAMAETTHIISNFSRIFDDAELEVLARVGVILVSLDTVDIALLKEIRRKVDLRTMVTNIVNVRATALRLGVAPPRFQINSGIYDRNVFGLADLARFCVALRVESVSFWSLVVHSVFAKDVRCDTVESLTPPELCRAVAVIEEAIDVLGANGVECIIPGGFIDEIKAMAHRQPVGAVA
jgi:MoaA/NifB/PqqE/SkfB family radical SAM enzyme